MNRFATLAVADNPLLPAVHAARPLRPGTRICDVVPRDTPAAMVKVDGQWILRAQWGHVLQPGQHMEVHHLPAGNDGRKVLRLVLTIAAAYIIGPAGLTLQGTPAALALAASSIAINALIPFKQPSIGGLARAGSPTYNTALSGNRAALNEPIPVLYGRHLVYPPFAADPYVEYDNDTNDQYYHALLCIGMGEYTLEKVLLDDTDIDHFQDVQYTLLAPGEAPTLVLAHVVTAAEVADLPINAGRATPAIAACRGDLTATAIGVDVVFSGLGDASGGSVTNFSVDIRVDWRPLDHWGVPLGPWATLATETITEASTEPVRRTFYYELGSDGPARPEVRLVRTTPRDDDPTVRNDATWSGLRAYLDQAATLNANATHLEVRMRATEQLNGLTQRRLAVIPRRLLHTWDPDTGWSAEPEFTRSIAWAIVDKLRSTVYGNGLPDERIDLDTFHALDAVWADRQDHLDVVFDTSLESDEADQIMARAGRAHCYWRNGVRTIVRDEVQTMPVAAYSARDIVPGSASLSLNMDAGRIPDGVIVEFLSHRGWEWQSITCPAPGVSEPTRPEYMRLVGVTGATQAEREGLYEAAVRVKRRMVCSITTELQGMIPSYGSLVVQSLPLRGWGQHGDVVDYDAGSLTLELTEEPEWTSGEDHYITLVRPDGSPTEGILCTAGSELRTVVLDEAPDFTPITDDARRERTRWIFGATAQHRREMLVLAVTPERMREDGAMLVQVTTVNDDADIHAADNALLPSSSDEVQDPIDSPNEEGPGGDVFVPYLTDRTASDDAPAGGNTVGVTLRLNTDGTLQIIKTYAASTQTIANQWVLGAPIGESDADAFEVYATLVSGSLTSGTTASWLLMDTQRNWSVSAGPGDGDSENAVLDLQIRDGSGLVQAQGRFNLSCSTAEFGGGE